MVRVNNAIRLREIHSAVIQGIQVDSLGAEWI